MKEKPLKKKNILVRFILFLLAFAVILGALGLVVFRDKLNMDSLRRWFTYRSLTLSDDGQVESFQFPGLTSGIFANLEGDLLVCSNYSFCLYSSSGTRYVEQSVAMTSPVVDVSGGTALIYDVGGSQVYVVRQREIALRLTCNGNLIAAHLGPSGMICTVSQESGYRGVITVYDGEGQVTASLRLSSSYVMDAVLTDNGTRLAILSVEEQNGAFNSLLSFYDLSISTGGNVNYDVTAEASVSLGDNVMLGMESRGGQVMLLGDRGAIVVDGQGETRGSTNWSEFYLKGFSLSGDDFAAVFLGRQRGSSQGELYVLNEDGTLRGTLSLEEQVLGIDASGRYVSILTTNRLDIYTSDLTLYNSLSLTQGVHDAVLRPDGTAFLISANSAQLYIP